MNLTNTAAWRAPIDELVPVGPIRVIIQPPVGLPLGGRAQLRVSGRACRVGTRNGKITAEIPSVLDHELVVFG